MIFQYTKFVENRFRLIEMRQNKDKPMVTFVPHMSDINAFHAGVPKRAIRIRSFDYISRVFHGEVSRSYLRVMLICIDVKILFAVYI